MSVYADNSSEELRARALFKNIRCISCESQTIADSNAPIADDMRNFIRTDIKNGKTDEEILSYLSERYGEQILMEPPVHARTAFLWFGPVGFILAGFVIAYMRFKRQPDISTGE